MSRACAYWRGEIGAYIVGALDEQDASLLFQHLAICADCRAEFEELVPVRSWLGCLFPCQAVVTQ